MRYTRIGCGLSGCICDAYIKEVKPTVQGADKAPANFNQGTIMNWGEHLQTLENMQEDKNIKSSGDDVLTVLVAIESRIEKQSSEIRQLMLEKRAGKKRPLYDDYDYRIGGATKFRENAKTS